MIRTRTTRGPAVEICAIDRYTRAWAAGTGLPVSLAPGEYRITGREFRNGKCYLWLNAAYRLDATQVGVSRRRR